MLPERVLVAGATGNQGGAVARHLMERGIEVYALTRDEYGDSSRELDELGAHIVEANLRDKESLHDAVREGDVDAVYCVTTPIEGPDAEIEQGTNLGEVAAEHGVEQFVFSSVWGADEDTGISFSSPSIQSSADWPIWICRSPSCDQSRSCRIWSVCAMTS